MPTSGLAALAAVLALLVVINWPSKEPASHVLTPATETGYVIIKLDDVNRGLLQQELQSGNLVAVNAQSGKRIPLQVDKTELPIGDYTLVCDAAEWRLHPLPFSVAFNVERTLTPTVDLRFPWKFPQIPSEAGSSCEYEGRLWYVDMGGSSRTASIPYLVKLSMLAQDESAPAALRRLKVEVRDQQNAYSETAYLLIDVPAWQEDRNLEITRGWLMADSRIIRDQLAQELAEQSPGRLLVKFDDKHDTLVEAARSRNLPLPDKRVSVHDVLVLLFGAACEPAQPWIRQVRAHLPSPQRYRYDQVDVSRGPWPCLVVDSTSAPPPGLGHVPSFLLPFLPVPAPSATGKAQPPAEGMTLYLARNHSIPFSFAKIEVTSPVFEATLKVRDFDSLQSPSAAAPAEATFREAVALLEAPAARSPFDRARLPKEQVGVVYYGDLALGGRPLLFRADVRSVGNESVDGVPHRWLEISVESGPQLEHKEEARVLVNETRYEQGEFTIERGLFVCQDVVLPFELSGESRELEENFHFLDKPLPSQRLGVHDVLAMLFDAKAGSLFNALRAQLSAVPGERKLTWKEINFGSQKKSVDAWELKADGGKPNAPSYSIERSPDIPFEFVNVKVNAPPFLALAVRLKPEELHRDVASKLVEASLEMRRRVTSDLLKAAKESHPNWRLWSLRDQPTPLWAEYGGSAVGTSKILLRDRYGTILQPIHRGDLTDSGDQALVERGRTWYNPSGAPLFRGELAEARGLRLTFHRTDTGRIELRSLSDFSLEDQELLKHLRELLKAVAPEKSAPPASVPRNRRSSTSTFPSTRR